MSFGLGAPVLVLNRNYLPVRVTTARMAFELLYQGRARALDAHFELHTFESWGTARTNSTYETIGTTRGPLPIPRIVVLGVYNRVPATILRLSRRNVYLRDDYTCQYCGDQPGVEQLNLDHVVPRSRGGDASWDNLVTSCKSCNLKKGRALPEECGMIPKNAPSCPRWSTAVQFQAMPRSFAEWEPFIGQAHRTKVRKAG